MVDGQALLTVSINKDVRLEEDVIASIKTMGIIGDKYVSVSRGSFRRVHQTGRDDKGYATAFGPGKPGEQVRLWKC